ncbi:MAG: cupin domain-containing protein [Deltaproteobacteria bacterium]|nr:cupin domain-containing protein [Deltaproteobacteria bacterium]
MKRQIKVIRLQEALKNLKSINQEIRYKSLLEGRVLSTGLISFRPRKDSDPKQIKHRDKDVLCHVVRGSGRLRVNGRRISLKPGTICHIPRGTPHDFAAGRKRELVLFYSLITTG